MKYPNPIAPHCSSVFQTMMSATCALLLLLFSAFPVRAATYYVKAGGDDRLNGFSDETAWATVEKVRAETRKGDIVFFRSQDTWSSATLPVLEATAGVTYDGSCYGDGTRATFRADGGYTGSTIEAVVNIFASDVVFSGFEIDGNSHLTGGIYVGTHAKTDIANIRIDDCVVHDNGGPESTPRKYYYGIHIGSIMNRPTTVADVSVTNTAVFNTGHEGIAIYPTWAHPDNRVDGVLVRGCTIHDTAFWGGDDWGSGIAVVNNADNVTIEFNTVYNAFRGVGVSTSRVYSGSPDNLAVRYNLIHHNTVAGIIFICPSGIDGSGDFYGNLIFNNGKPWRHNYSAEIIVGGWNFNDSVFHFFNNTIYSTDSRAKGGKWGVLVPHWSPTDGNAVIDFRNNIVCTGDYPAISDLNGVITHSSNLIYRYSGPEDEVVKGGASYDRSAVLEWEPSAQTTDPNFSGGVLPSGFRGHYGIDLMPKTDFFAIRGGDALNTGENLGSPYDGCINGAGSNAPVQRPQESSYDIGAYERRNGAP